MKPEIAQPTSSREYRPTGVALERLEAELTELWGHLTAATYRFLTLVAEFDRSEAYARHGLPSTAHWLNWQCGIGMTAARAKVRVARALEHLPEVSAGFARRQVLVFESARDRARRDGRERIRARAHRALRHRVARREARAQVPLDAAARRREKRTIAAPESLRPLLLRRERHVRANARLPPEIGAIVAKALQAAGDVLREQGQHEPRDERSELARQGESTLPWSALSTARAGDRADALRLVADAFLAARSEEVESTSIGDRFQVVVHVDQAVLAEPRSAAESEPHRSELDAGPALALATVRRLCCGGTVVGILEGRDGEPLNIGRKSRAIPPAMRRAMLARDGGCRFPGCDRTRFCDGHHVKHWASGGETKLGNLVTLCSFHHTLVHEGGFGVTVTDDGVFVFTRPDGKRIPECGPEKRAGDATRFRGIVPTDAETGDSSDTSTTRLTGQVNIDATTSRCKWLGERMDYSWVIESMQFRESNSATAALPAAPS